MSRRKVEESQYIDRRSREGGEASSRSSSLVRATSQPYRTITSVVNTPVSCQGKQKIRVSNVSIRVFRSLSSTQCYTSSEGSRLLSEYASKATVSCNRIGHVRSNARHKAHPNFSPNSTLNALTAPVSHVSLSRPPKAILVLHMLHISHKSLLVHHTSVLSFVENTNVP